MATRGSGQASSIRRRAPFRNQKKRILIVCEGERTERQYFEDLKRDTKVLPVTIVVAPETGDPLTVVTVAVRRMRAADRQARSEGSNYLRYDAVWGDVDVDDHARLPQARRVAAENGVELAVSNPCFELWALLHYQDQTAHIERDRLRLALQRHQPGYDKLLDFGRMHPGYAEAVRRAISLDAQADAHGESGRNPTTGVYRLTKLIIDD